MAGIGLELYGILQLFRDFLPTALPFLRKVPVLGHLLSLPMVKQARAPRARCPAGGFGVSANPRGGLRGHRQRR